MACALLLKFIKHPIDKTFEIHFLSEKFLKLREPRCLGFFMGTDTSVCLMAVGPHTPPALRLLSGELGGELALPPPVVTPWGALGSNTHLLPQSRGEWEPSVFLNGPRWLEGPCLPTAKDLPGRTRAAGAVSTVPW